MSETDGLTPAQRSGQMDRQALADYLDRLPLWCVIRPFWLPGYKWRETVLLRLGDSWSGIPDDELPAMIDGYRVVAWPTDTERGADDPGVVLSREEAARAHAWYEGHAFEGANEPADDAIARRLEEGR